MDCRGHPLTEEEKVKGAQRRRVRVEHVFVQMSQIGMDKARTIGLRPETQYSTLSNSVHNMNHRAYLIGRAGESDPMDEKQFPSSPPPGRARGRK